MDVSRGCVLAKDTKLPVSKKFTATILWMDDEELTVGKDYLVKLGTRTIPGILKNIQYKIDVNTGEFIPVGRLRKNEIAVCDLVLQEEIVIDAFAKHKTLGELILIDRISNMTSACGVVENPTLDETKDLKCAFAHGNLKANGDIFEEYYYDLEAMNVFKVQPSDKTYTIGDVIPVKGETYQYPDSFDVVVLREQVAAVFFDICQQIAVLREQRIGGDKLLQILLCRDKLPEGSLRTRDGGKFVHQAAGDGRALGVLRISGLAQTGVDRKAGGQRGQLLVQLQHSTDSRDRMGGIKLGSLLLILRDQLVQLFQIVLKFFAFKTGVKCVQRPTIVHNFSPFP